MFCVQKLEWEISSTKTISCVYVNVHLSVKLSVHSKSDSDQNLDTWTMERVAHTHGWFYVQSLAHDKCAKITHEQSVRCRCTQIFGFAVCTYKACTIMGTSHFSYVTQLSVSHGGCFVTYCSWSACINRRWQGNNASSGFAHTEVFFRVADANMLQMCAECLKTCQKSSRVVQNELFVLFV